MHLKSLNHSRVMNITYPWWICNKYMCKKLSTVLRYTNIIRNLVLNFHYSLRRTWKNKHTLTEVHNQKHGTKEFNITSMVFLKFFGSSWSSKGYAPTSITYSVTPHDHTSAIWRKNSCRIKNHTMYFHDYLNMNTLLGRC